MTTISFSKARSDSDGGGGGYKEYGQTKSYPEKQSPTKH